MGCGHGKDENPNVIQSEMKWTKLPELDTFFKSASEFLEGLEDLRAAFQETREEMHELGRTEELKDPKLIEAFRVFFWACSAEKEGAIILCDLKFSMDPPSVTVDCGSMDWRTWDFSDAFKRLVGGFTGAPAKIVELTKAAAEVGEKAVEIGKSFSDTVKGSSLNPMEKARAIANCGVNIKRIQEGVTKAPNIFKLAQEALLELKDVIPQIPDLIAQADAVGKKAWEEKRIWRMSEIFEHYQTAPKKTEHEIKEDKKRKKGKWQRKSKHAPPKGTKETGKKPVEQGKAGEHKAEEHQHKEGEHAHAGEQKQ